MQIRFCPECSRKIRSAVAFKFWQQMNLKFIIQKTSWIFIEKEFDLLYLAVLEKKGFVVSFETDRGVWAYPKGLYEIKYEEEYFVCCNPHHSSVSPL